MEIKENIFAFPIKPGKTKRGQIFLDNPRENFFFQVEFTNKDKILSSTDVFNYRDLVFLNLPWSKRENGLKNNFIIDELDIVELLTGKKLNLKNKNLPGLNLLNLERKGVKKVKIKGSNQKYQIASWPVFIQKYSRDLINELFEHVHIRHYEDFLKALNLNTLNDIDLVKILNFFNLTDLKGKGWLLSWQEETKNYIYPLRVYIKTRKGYKKCLVQIVIKGKGPKKGYLVTMFPVISPRYVDD